MRTLIALIAGTVLFAAPFTGFAANDQPLVSPETQLSTDHAQAQDAQMSAERAMQEIQPRAAAPKKHASKKAAAHRKRHAKRTTKTHRRAKKQDAMRVEPAATQTLQ